MSAIIFDFDGTLANSFDYVAGFLAVEADVPLTDDLKQQLRGKSIVAMVRHMGNGYARSMWLFIKGRRLMRHSVKYIHPFEGMPEVVRKLHNEGHELFILSSNSVATIHDFLRQHDLHTYFLQVYGGVGLFNKAPALRSLLREHQLEQKEAFYIGDELRDVQAAQSIKLPVIAVSWGFARLLDLQKQKPTGLAHTPTELLQILQKD